jgi:hypothetical protein
VNAVPAVFVQHGVFHRVVYPALENVFHLLVKAFHAEILNQDGGKGEDEKDEDEDKHKSVALTVVHNASEMAHRFSLLSGIFIPAASSIFPTCR